MKDMGHHGVGDTDIEFRIIEVEKSAIREEEKVKEALYAALEDKKKIIEDLKEQLAFRNSALEHEITQRLSLEEDRKGLVYRLEKVLNEPQAIYTTEETQTESKALQSKSSQTETKKCIRAASSQTWFVADVNDKEERTNKQVQHLIEELSTAKKEHFKTQKIFDKKLSDLKLEYVRKTDNLTENHFHQEKALGETVTKVQQESNLLRKQLDEANEKLLQSEIGSESDTVDGSGFCCAPTRKKKKKKKGRLNGLPNPYGLHSSEKHGAFWNKSDI